MFTTDRDQLRRFFMQAWHKHQQNQPLEPLEHIIAKVVELHPEYHAILADEDQAVAREFHAEMGETNPFMHMGMHIALHEQLSSQRPSGIVDIYQGLLNQLQDPHAVEHSMMKCLSEALWQAQQNNTQPDEQAYLACLRQKLK